MNRTPLARTDMTVFSPTLSFSSCLEYKKKYGEEHGSCQAGIAGFFTEVSNIALVPFAKECPAVNAGGQYF